MKKIRLFCFTYAGGSAATYTQWNRSLQEGIDLTPIEFAGRGKRIKDLLYNSLFEAVDDMFNQIKDKIGEMPYAFFGHSMGSIIAFELAHKICSESPKQAPLHIFFSGSKTPDSERDGEIYSSLPDELFLKGIIKFGGISKDLLADKAALKIFLPILKQDCKILEEYQNVPKMEKLSCDISVLYGKKDRMDFYDALEWEKYTKGKCNIYSFEGGHFFINEVAESVINRINKTLAFS